MKDGSGQDRSLAISIAILAVMAGSALSVTRTHDAFGARGQQIAKAENATTTSSPHYGGTTTTFSREDRSCFVRFAVYRPPLPYSALELELSVPGDAEFTEWEGCGSPGPGIAVAEIAPDRWRIDVLSGDAIAGEATAGGTLLAVSQPVHAHRKVRTIRAEPFGHRVHPALADEAA